MWLTGRLTVLVLFLFLLVPGAAVLAQESPASDADDPAASGGSASKRKVALYFEVGRGIASAEDLDVSLETEATITSENTLKLEDMIYGRAAIGWKLDKGKGDIRLRYTGFREDGYEYSGIGRTRGLDPGLVLPPNTPVPTVIDPLVWWNVHIADGMLTSERTPPQWSPSSDVNQNGDVDLGEEFYLADPDFSQTRSVTADLQNTVQFTDLLYGRTFGKRRYSARWWGGIRHFTYEGNVLATAWLSSAADRNEGNGYTDGAFLRPLVLEQDSSGWGPTGALEVDFNFFDSRLSLYIQGQFAFMVASIDYESAPFFTIAQETSGSPLIPIQAQISESLTKSIWQNSAEVGLRVNLKSGVGFEFSYGVTGLLDIVVLPTHLRIPANPLEASQGTSATNRTRDMVFTGWRAGLSYQF